MLIKKISIYNFLCYSGSDNHFEFTEGLNLVLGANGYGKSKLYDAFQWVFNDGITDNSPRVIAGGLKPTSLIKGDLVSERSKKECAIGDSIETMVAIEIEYPTHRGKKEYQLIRKYSIRRTDDKSWIEPGNSEFHILEWDVLSFKPIAQSSYNEVLERLIPVDVRPYVWFQGERGISNLIDTSNDSSLRNVIKRLSDIERWDTYIQVAEKAYDTASNAFTQESKKSTRNKEKIEQLHNEQRLLLKTVAKLEEQITNASHNQRNAQDNKDSLLASMEFAETIDKLNSAKNNAENNYRNAVRQSDKFEESLSKKLFTDYWVLLNSTPLLEVFEKKLTTYNEAVADRKAMANLHKKLGDKLQIRLPDNVPEPMYVRTMLEKEHCLVCNRPAPKGTDAYNAINDLLKLPEPEIVQPEYTRQNLNPLFRKLLTNGLSINSMIETIDHRVQQSVLEQENNKEQVRVCKEELESKARELQQQKQSSGITNARDIVNSMNIAVADIKKYEGHLVHDNTEKKQKEDRLREIDTELNKISEGEVAPHLIRKKEILSDLVELSKRVKKTKYQELVQQLEDNANIHYRNINEPTGAFYGRIRFIATSDGGYRPAIVDNDGREVSNLNTSLVSSLKLSIIMAIVSANKTRNYATFYPLISDAPVSDFDLIKSMTFFKETASTFNQSIIIVKELLVEDPTRKDRYKPDIVPLKELSSHLKATGKTLNVYQLDIPDGISTSLRSEIKVLINKVDC